MTDRKWYRLSDHIRVLCVSDFNQDAILLVDINGRLVFNRNDASDHGWEHFVRRIIKRYDTSFLLALSSRFGDADMINHFDENGQRVPILENVPSLAPATRTGPRLREPGILCLLAQCTSTNARIRCGPIAITPHCPITGMGFRSKHCEILTAYLRYDCERDSAEKIDPPEIPTGLHSPAEFGDDWQELLSEDDLALAKRYFASIEHLSGVLDFVNLRVGGRDNFITLRSRRNLERGITFEVPRNSLVLALQYEIFDDLLIGNFMKTTLPATWDLGACIRISVLSWRNMPTMAEQKDGKTSRHTSTPTASGRCWIFSGTR